MVFFEDMSRRDGQAGTDVRIADELWIATALLHIEHPEREDFALKEIEDRVRREAVAGDLRKGVYPHVSLHAVANLPPNPGRYRMLFATGRHRRRLFRPGDGFHPDREGSKTAPAPEDIPAKYWYLFDWYARTNGGETPESRPAAGGALDERSDPILALRGAGRSIWEGEDPDAYVRRVREGRS
jgi:hypothetical protein